MLEEDAASAEALLEECSTLNRDQDEYVIAWTLNHRRHVGQPRGEYDQAAQLHTESLASFIDIFSEKNVSRTWLWHSLGETALGQGDLAAARKWLVADLRLCDEVGDRIVLAWCLAGLGTAAALDEESERAARLWGAAERLRIALGCRPAPPHVPPTSGHKR